MGILDGIRKWRQRRRRERAVLHALVSIAERDGLIPADEKRDERSPLPEWAQLEMKRAWKTPSSGIQFLRTTDHRTGGQSGGLLIPTHPSSYEHLINLSRVSSVLRTVIIKLREEIFRRGFEVKPLFLKKCPRCGYHTMSYEEETCPDCARSGRGRPPRLVEPDPDQKKELDKWVTNPVNSFGQPLSSLVRELEDDLNIVDDAYLLMVKEYEIDPRKGITDSRPLELVRLDPARVRIVVGPTGDIGDYWKTCVVHRNLLVPIHRDWDEVVEEGEEPEGESAPDQDWSSPSSSKRKVSTAAGVIVPDLLKSKSRGLKSSDLPRVKQKNYFSSPTGGYSPSMAWSLTLPDRALGGVGGRGRRAMMHLPGVDDRPPGDHRGVNDDGRVVLVEDASDECPACGLPLYPVEYVMVRTEYSTDIEMPFIRGEIVHVNKYSQSKYYGYSPVLSVWYEAVTLHHMTTYMHDYYSKRRIPRGILMVPFDDDIALERMMEAFAEGLAQDPNFIPVMRISTLATQKPEFIKLMDNPSEMNYINVRDELRNRISALYGVSNIFMADTSTGAGLTNQGTQLIVTNRAVESGQRIWNEIVFPAIVQAMGITDWCIEVLPPEEKDQMAPEQLLAQRLANAEKMLSLGFDVEYDPDEEKFRFSGQPIVHPNVISSWRDLMELTGGAVPPEMQERYHDLAGMAYQNPNADEGALPMAGQDPTGEGRPRSGDSDCIDEKMAQLRSEHPDWTDEQVRRRAEHLCGRDRSRRATSQDRSSDRQTTVRERYPAQERVSNPARKSGGDDDDGLEKCVQYKIPIIREEHPDWDHDQVVAVAYSWCREHGSGGKKKKEEEDE